MKKFLIGLSLVLFGCASDVTIPTGFVVTDVAAAPPPAPPKDSAPFPNVSVEVSGGNAVSVKARSGGCAGGRCRVRPALAKVRIVKR